MNACITREAKPHTGDTGPLTALIAIDGYQWSSPIPSNSGEAQSFNEDARRIVDAINRAR